MTRPPVEHYIHGQWEAIDVIRGMMPAGLTPYQGYLWGSVMKYMLRVVRQEIDGIHPRTEIFISMDGEGKDD